MGPGKRSKRVLAEQPAGAAGARQSVVTAAFLEHHGYLKKFLSRFLRVQQDIEDVAQETYLRAYVAEQRESIEQPVPFLFRVAKNLALTRLSRKSAGERRRWVSRESSDEVIDVIPDSLLFLRSTAHSSRRRTTRRWRLPLPRLPAKDWQCLRSTGQLLSCVQSLRYRHRIRSCRGSRSQVHIQVLPGLRDYRLPHRRRWP